MPTHSFDLFIAPTNENELTVSSTYMTDSIFKYIAFKLSKFIDTYYFIMIP